MTDAPAGPAPLNLPAPEGAADWLAERTTTLLAQAREGIAALKRDRPTDPAEAAARWNDLELTLTNLAAPAHTMSELHPDEATRARGDDAVQEVERLRTELSLDRDLFEVFSALDPAAVAATDPLAARLLVRVVRDFRRSGVDGDEASRARVTEISERMVQLSQEFGKNIRDDVRSIRVTPDRLAGLPQDWIDAHPVGDDGLVEVTTDYPDYVPFMMFADDAESRRRLSIAYLSRAWPDNDALLQELLGLRREFAALVGYASWPDYDTEVKMIGSGSAVAEFIDQIAEASAESGKRDVALLLERLQQDRPEATTIDRADAGYYTEKIRKERFDVDAQDVRRYFDFTRVRDGLLEVTGRLLGLDYRPAPDAVLWHEDVDAYDVHLTENGERVGRIYLDLHPREGKYKHAAQFDLQPGVAGRQLAEGVLGCNVGTGLIEHDDVVTLFHEFGHLVHHVLAGRGQYVRFSGVATEWDFVEAPSQLLEEWAWDADVLRSFATDAEGNPIPAELVARMRTANDFGKGSDARTQMFYAALSYYLHAEQTPDITARTKELQEAYSLFPFIDGTHMAASFGHLDGYSSGYYTYMWSLVIAKDLFSAFDRSNMFDPEVAHRYRDVVLAPGGQKDAAELVADFLGRPYSVDAFAAWLAE
ncbi:M3 family metallopeptidase [Pseudactinotalea suaedae]|uniref:M3 family metallopeptidase n=1 Tax=Pseudactinotalea suaedae TaxID=1524924 RepID=UPI0012E31E50|nr:M3 family metallopeptidase [Pseudactinotalea suaedae]